jgi:cyclohexanone monooxygenase
VEQDEAKSGYPAVFRRRAETNSGFDYSGIGVPTFSVSERERLATYERLWATGGFAFWAGNFTDVLLDERANRAAYDFWRDQVRARLSAAGVASSTAAALAPSEPPHPFGVKRPSLEQTYYDVFGQDNVSLVDLHETAFDASGLDVLVLATGFDAVTGGLTSIDLRGTTGESLRSRWAGGVAAHLGLATSGFPNLLYLYGPQSPAGFCNGPTCAEVQGDWVVELLLSLFSSGASRVEATPAAEQAWGAQVQAIAAATLWPRADSWYMGANIPGKPREMLNWPGGLQLYLEACRASAAAGYEGFTIA